MDQTTTFLTILGMAAVTFLPRFLPAWFLAKRTLPPGLSTWLGFVPAAVIAAMLMPWLLTSEERLHISHHNIYLWAALPTLACALKTRSFLGTMLVGVAIVACGRALMAA